MNFLLRIVFHSVTLYGSNKPTHESYVRVSRCSSVSALSVTDVTKLAGQLNSLSLYSSLRLPDFPSV